MDAKEMGRFIAELRKEKHMTQAELAGKLHVTDKAVSRWERGVGFPDIHTIEPLAEALDISILEIMKAKRVTEPIEKSETASVYNGTLDIINSKRKRKTRILAAGMVIVMIFLSLVFLFPMRLGGQMNQQEELQVSVSAVTIENGEPVIETTSYALCPGTMEYIALVRTLNQYPYHRNLFSFGEDAKLSDFLFVISASDFYLSVARTDKIILNGHSYTLGYGKGGTGKKLSDELLEIVSLL